jgi:hypothetical protein
MADHKQIVAISKQGHSLSQISELTGLTTDEVKETPGEATGLPSTRVGFIFEMTQRGLSLEQINQGTVVELEVPKQFLPIEIHTLADSSALATTEYSTEPYKPQPTETLPKPHIPTFFYCCHGNSNELHRVNLLTGEQSCHKVPNYLFTSCGRWSELPGGTLLFTGGEDSREAVKIDTLRECAVSSLPPMHSARRDHVAVYHSQYLYVLGGWSGRSFSECERYVCAESQWEVLPALPVAVCFFSAVELDSSLYALGGRDGFLSDFDTVQKLSLDSLFWELMQLKLPQTSRLFPCFKTDTEVYLVIKQTLYSFTPFEVKPIKTLPEYVMCYSSYYNRGTLYYEKGAGMQSLSVGDLTY